MTQHVERLYLLIHPLTYVDHEHEYTDKDFFRLALDCEDRVAPRWREKISQMSAGEILVLLPSRPQTKSMRALQDFAHEHLAERCILVNRSNRDWSHREFWESFPGGSYEWLGREVRDTLVARRSLGTHQDDFVTGIQAYSYVEEIRSALSTIDMALDPDTVRAEGWGESFEGCVAKYSQMMGKHLGLRNPIEVDFEMTVPDARFLLSGTFLGSHALPNGVRLYLFRGKDDVPLAVLFESLRKPSDPLRSACVALDPARIRLSTSEGTEARLPDDQELHVRFEGGLVHVPLVWAGYEYAAHFIFGTGYSSDEFEEVLKGASVPEA